MSGFQYYLTLFTFFTGQETDAFKSENNFHTFVCYVTKQSRFFSSAKQTDDVCHLFLFGGVAKRRQFKNYFKLVYD